MRRALTESGLGEDTIDGRFSSTLRQTTFSAGMKGVTDENIANVEALIESTLQKLVTEGIDPADISAAINTLEFRLREANTGSAPRGLIYMLGALSSWIYDKDPYESLRYEAPLHNVREAIAQGGYFESLIGQYLLENNHRSVVILKPDTELAQQIEQKETDKLAAAKANMSQADLEAIIANTEELRARQERQDSPEELEKLPSLTVNDLEKEGKSLPISIDHYDQAKVISHNLFTNGIVYFRLGLNLHVLPNELLPYVPLFCYSLTEMGTETEDYVQLGQRIGRLTGGVSAFRQISSTRQQKEAISWLWVRGKATMDHAQDMLDIMHDILHTVQLDNKERFLQMLLEEKASSESSIVPGGHIATITRLRARFSEAGWASEQMGGIEYLFFLRRLVEDVKNDWSGVLEKLERIRYLLVNRNHMICDTTLDADHYKTFVPLVHKLLDTFPSNEVVIEKWDQKTLPENEGLVIPSQVNYVGKAVNLFEHGFTHHGSVAVITKLLGTGYLWDKVRLQGGAYGAFMPYNSTTGVLSFCSYRDPNIVPTLNAYDGTADFLANLELTQSQIDKAIIGVIGDLDSYQLPDAKGATALNRYLHGITDDYRQMRRDEVLGTTLADLKRFATVLPAVSQHAHTVVIGSAEAIAEANATLETELTITPIM